VAWRAICAPTQTAPWSPSRGFRDECLNIEVFEDLDDPRRKIRALRSDYNRVRPHSPLVTSLKEVPPEVEVGPLRHCAVALAITNVGGNSQRSKTNTRP
jgi:Integrase core domain